MSERTDTAVGAALAGLTLCESLIVALVEKGVLDEVEVDEICEVAREAQLRANEERGARSDTVITEKDRERAAALIERIRSSSNSARIHPVS